ncbi:hypothetical protein N7456_008205 [Penicillium angulare]|uniref:Zn(2)-C6 fungal-type domain-containing protein n=1 Tax=Penicillium angulare TaxID=116970 RepID=A0A9W9K8W4_9EURO|nr:hypothetical protein N7456_008205 [Penicillium angulare]
MTPTASRESPELEGPPKRRRTILACNECREKKRKCDGVKPICSACKRRDFSECVWDEERINKVWNNRYIDSLKARIRDLESQQQPLSQNGGDQLGETSISLEEASPIPSSLNQEHMPIDTEAAIPSSHTSPRGQVQTQENREPSLPHDLAVLSCDVPDWNFDMSHPITNKTTSPATNEAGATNEDDEDEVDAMGVISNFPNPNDGRKRKACTYFGPSSTKGLLDKAHGRCPSLSDTCTTPPAHTKENPQNASARSYKSRNDSGVFGMVMPSRPEADGFVESYWRWTHSLYPFIHRPSFEERYLTIWYPHIWTSSSDQSIDSSTAKGIYTNISDRLFYCMLNTVFSLGALFSARIDPEERADVAYSFYERAKKLLDVDLLADGSLALVQTLLLMGQYLQSTEMSNSCWNIIGLAVRVAQCIGLHHDPQNCDQGCCSTQSLDQVEIEMRRRAWTGCIMLDRVLSLTYGRPLMVHSTTSQSQLMLPSPIDDQYLVQSTTNIGSQPEETPSLVDCYIQAVKLQEILGHILTLFYYGNPPCNQEQNLSEILFNSSKEPTNTPRVGTTDIQKILKVDKVLIEWHNKLPAHLKVESYEDGADIGQVEAHNRAIFHRQATILEMRQVI